MSVTIPLQQMASPETINSRKTTRRTFLQLGGTALAALGLSQLGFRPSYRIESTPIQRPEIIGASFSQVQCRHLKMSDNETKETYLRVLDMGFDLLRIGAYMDEIDERGFDFLDWQIEEAEKRGIRLMLNVGVKVQRYPEFHPPVSMKERLRFWEKPNQTIGEDNETFDEVVNNTRNVIERYKNRRIIDCWQIENEPFDRLAFANNHVVAESLLDKEIEVLKKEIPSAKLSLSEAIGLPDSEDNFRSTIDRKPDISGFNIYYKVPRPYGGYYELNDSDFDRLAAKNQILKQNNIKPIIFESQAEPWENGAPVHTEKMVYPSSNPELAVKLASKLTSIGYDTVMLWGCEYWIYLSNRGNTSWVDKISQYIKLKNAA